MRARPRGSGGGRIRARAFRLCWVKRGGDAVMHQNCRCVGGLLVGTGVGRVGFRLVSLGFCFFTPPVTPLSQRGMPLMSAPLLSPPPPRTLPPIPKRALFSESQKLFSPLSPSLFFFSLYFSFSFIFLSPFFFFPFFFPFLSFIFFLKWEQSKKKKREAEAK